MLRIVFTFILSAAALMPLCGFDDRETNHQLWQQQTQGHNLALGKKFTFSLPPLYNLTKDEKDPYDLTDGKLSTQPKDKIWFDRNAVGWYANESSSGVNLLIDLEKVENISKVCVRLLGGAEQRGLIFPRQVEVYVSKDGQQYYQAAGLQKLMPGEKEQSDFKKYFFLPEDGTAYVYPLPLEINAEARYVIIRIYGASNAIFSDEIAIMEGNSKAEGFNQAYQAAPEQLPMRGIIARPNCGRVVVPSNLAAPNSFFINDMRDPKNQKVQAELIIELPPEIILEAPAIKPEAVTINGKTVHRYRKAYRKFGGRSQTEMFYFRANGALPPEATATLYVECADEPVWQQSFPLEVIEFPTIQPPLTGFPIDLSWMGVSEQEAWPGFLENWNKFGFDAVTCFPRYYQTDDKRQELRDYLQKARKHDYKVVMNESPFHIMQKDYADKAEIYTQRKDGKPSKALCPSYQGEYYRKELERIEANVRLASPDRIYWDIECWYNGALDAVRGQCTRCTEAVEKSGTDVKSYLRQCGVRMLRDLKEAVRKGMDGKPMPTLGSYNHHASAEPHHYLFAALDAWPEAIDQMQPSLYVAGRSELVHQAMRQNYQALKARRIFPWLSTGTYGEFPSYKLEQMIYEVLMNGGEGFGYYWFGDFDTPLDYYYHAKALATVAPYQEILKKGQPWFNRGSNKELFYSGQVHSGEMLLLVGNYLKAPGQTAIELPFHANTILDIRNGKKFSATQTLTLDIPKDQICLLYLKK